MRTHPFSRKRLISVGAGLVALVISTSLYQQQPLTRSVDPETVTSSTPAVLHKRKDTR
jgi:hypothetical protein